MPTFSSILNWAIPAGVILFLFSIFYGKFRETFDTMFGFIKSGFSAVTGSGSKVKEKAEDYTYTYRFGEG